MFLFDPQDPRPVHFMGIAGAGMSALALVARRRGVPVTGCDLDLRDARDLVAAGALVVEGHGAPHADGARAVVHTSAVPANHPELIAANASGVPTLKRAVALGKLIDGATVVGVAGTHGKTTVTTMVTEALTAAGLHPSGLVGGRVDAWGGNAWLDGDELYVVEADEYDRSFLDMHPTIAIINNVEADHLECYGDFGALQAAFVEFGNRAERVLLGADDMGARELAHRFDVPVWTVGLEPDADVFVHDLQRDASRTRGKVRLAGGAVHEFSLQVPGLHNVRNAAMAVAAADALGAATPAAFRALGAFGGVGRRFDVVADAGGITVIDDYAHHPSEVRATLEAARQRFPGRRLVAVFQPHLFSRTALHGAALGEALAAADHVIITDVYPAREAPLTGVTGELVVHAARASGATVEWVPSLADLAGTVRGLMRPGDAILVLGAGSVTRVAAELARSVGGTAA